MKQMCEAVGQRSSHGRCPVCRTREITLVPGMVTEDDGITYNRLLMEPHIAGAGLGPVPAGYCPGSGQGPVTDSTGRLACPECLGVQPVHKNDPAIVQLHKIIRFPVSKVQDYTAMLQERGARLSLGAQTLQEQVAALPVPASGEQWTCEQDENHMYRLALGARPPFVWRGQARTLEGVITLRDHLAAFVTPPG